MLAHFGKLTTLLMILALCISWWLAPAPEARALAQNRYESWRLPIVSSSDTAKSAEKFATIIATTNLWGAAVQAGAEISLNEPEWRFSGLTVNGQEKSVMITIEGKPMQTLKAGDHLPGGARILEINDDHLCLSIKGKKRKLDLF